MIHYDPKVQAAIISQRMNRPAHIAAGSGRREKNNSEICTCTGWIIRVFFAARAQSLHAIEPARLCRAAQMGVWGDGCCQLTDQAVGRWSHCYSPHRHVGHVRHVPWRHTRAGWCCVPRFWCLLCIICHIGLRICTEETALCQAVVWK